LVGKDNGISLLGYQGSNLDTKIPMLTI